jgi:SAM-dependent methyltransferase
LTAQRIFDAGHYESLNTSRGAVVSAILSELSAPLALHSAIDVGCGLGHFSGLLKSLDLRVTAVDGRPQNVQEAQRRYPDIPFRVCDAQEPALSDFGRFDLVFCFGLLYHLENPLATIRTLQGMTAKLLLVESVIFPGNEPIMALVDEGNTEDQGLNHIAFYPTEACLTKMLYRAGFENVYEFTTQPDHPEYRSTQTSRRTRTVLAASHSPLQSTQLRKIPEASTPIAPWDPRSGAPEPGPLRKLLRFVGATIPGKVQSIKRAVRS